MRELCVLRRLYINDLYVYREMEGAMSTTDAQQTAVKKRKGYKFKPGTVAVREIKKLQKSTKLCIPVKSFHRLVKELAQNYKSDCKFSDLGVKALHDDAENYVTEYFHKSQNRAIRAGRTTIKVDDMKEMD